MSVNDLVDRESVGAIAGLMRLLGDPTRIRILGLLQPGAMNVSALCDQLDLAQPTVSHHLAMLRTAGLLLTRRAGKQIFYSLNPEHLASDDDGGLRLVVGRVKMLLGCREHARSSARSAALLN